MTCICITATGFGFVVNESYEYSIERHKETNLLLYNVKLPFDITLPGSIEYIPFVEGKFNQCFIDLQSKRDKIISDLGI